MALPACRRCGKTDSRKMIGLMTHWFGPFIDLPAGSGYFHLCPGCYLTQIEPHLEAMQGRLAELHPLGPDPDEAGRNGDGGTVPAGPAERARAADEAARRSMHRVEAERGEAEKGDAGKGDAES